MRDRTAELVGDAGGAGRRRAVRGDGQDVGGDRPRAEERAERPGHGGRADRAGSRQRRRASPRLRPQVVGEIARLRDVVDSLLSFSRSPRIDRAPADLAGVIARAVGAAVRAGRRTRRWTVTVDAPPTLRTRCDGHKIQGVVVNLVKNAIEAGKRVEVALRADGRRGDHRGRRRRPGPVGGGARSTCSSRSSPPSRTAPGWGCRPRAASWRRTAADRGRHVGGAGRRAVPPAASAGGRRRAGRQGRRRRAHEADRPGDRRREDVPHRRRGGAVGRGLHRHDRGDRRRRGWRPGSASRSISSSWTATCPTPTASRCWRRWRARRASAAWIR